MCPGLCRLLRLRHVVDVVPALSAAAEVAASRTDLHSYILRVTLQVPRIPRSVVLALQATLCQYA